MSIMNAITSVIAVLPVGPENVSRYLMGCRVIVTMMTGNDNFPKSAPLVEEVSAALDTLEAREELALKGGKGMVKERDVALRQAHTKVTLLRAYVQSVANEAGEKAEAVVQSAGMNVKKPSARTKPSVGAKHGNAPGKVVLDAKALPKPVQYRWQMSIDEDTWTDLPETFVTKTVVEGLARATVYSFRLRTVTKNGPSDWSPPVTIAMP
jgi:hypothetical protein